MHQAFFSSTLRDIYTYYTVCSFFLHPLLKGLGTSRPHRQFAASLSQVFPLACIASSPRVYMGMLRLHKMSRSYKPRHVRTSLSHVPKGNHVEPSLSDHVSRSLSGPVPLYHTYLKVVTPPEVVNQFTGHESPGFSPVPEGHRCIGLEHVISVLVT